MIDRKVLCILLSLVSTSVFCLVLQCRQGSGRTHCWARVPGWQVLCHLPLVTSSGMPAHPPLHPSALPGGVLHSHVPLRRAGHPPHPGGHTAWSWGWHLVLHHAQVGEAHGRHGGPLTLFLADRKQGWGWELLGMGHSPECGTGASLPCPHGNPHAYFRSRRSWCAKALMSRFCS